MVRAFSPHIRRQKTIVCPAQAEALSTAPTSLFSDAREGVIPRTRNGLDIETDRRLRAAYSSYPYISRRLRCVGSRIHRRAADVLPRSLRGGYDEAGLQQSADTLQDDVIAHAGENFGSSFEWHSLKFVRVVLQVHPAMRRREIISAAWPQVLVADRRMRYQVRVIKTRLANRVSPFTSSRR